MAKMDILQSALNSSTARTSAPPPPPPSASDVEAFAPTPRRQATGNKVAVNDKREGEENVSAYLPRGFKKSIRLAQAKIPGDPSLKQLLAEALNDLFSKYNVPTVSE